jgi:hypothetical protein
VDHELKCWPIYFQAVWDRLKGFEVRENDRNFQVGHTVTLREWIPFADYGCPSGYTGRVIKFRIPYLTDFGQKPGTVVLGIADQVNITAA